MRRRLNLLFTSVGRRVELVKAFRAAAVLLGMDVGIVVADLTRNAAAAHLGETYASLPPIGSGGYVDAILDLCRRFEVTCLIPLVDPELTLLAARRDELMAAGVRGFVSSLQTMQISDNKNATYRFFKHHGIATPEVHDIDATLANPEAQYPIILKPACGSSSIGVVKVENREELAFYRGRVKEPLLQEYLSGDEYTLDMLVDKQGRVVSVVPRLRMEVRAGEVSKGMTVRNEALIAATRLVGERLPGAEGCITIQCFLTDAGVVFTEINPRFGGGVPLAIAAGCNLPAWMLQSVTGDDADDGLVLNWRGGEVMLRYDAAVFIGCENLSASPYPSSTAAARMPQAAESDSPRSVSEPEAA